MKYLEFYDSSLIVIEIAVIWSRKDGDDCWELFGTRPFVHLESFCLGLMGSNDRNNFILFKEMLGQLAPKEIGTPSRVIILY